MADNQKDKFRKMSIGEIRDFNELESNIAIAKYLTVGGNGPEAKMALGFIGSRAKDRQSANNKRLLDVSIGEKLLAKPELKKLIEHKEE